MKMPSALSVREVSGLVIASLGVALVPIGWYAGRKLWFLALVLVVIGLVMLLSERVVAAEKAVEAAPAVNTPPVKQGTPADIHNYSGWQDAGHSLGGDGGGDAD